MYGDETFWFDIAKSKHYVLFKARKDILKYIESLNLTCMVDKEWLLHKDPYLDTTRTVLECLAEKFDSTIYVNLKDTLDFTTQKEIEKLLKCFNFEYKYRAYCRVNGKINTYVKGLCEYVTHCISEWKKAKAIVGTYNNSYLENNLISAVIIKTKGYRVNMKTYNKYKCNELIKLLCKK